MQNPLQMFSRESWKRNQVLGRGEKVKSITCLYDWGRRAKQTWRNITYTGKAVVIISCHKIHHCSLFLRLKTISGFSLNVRIKTPERAASSPFRCYYAMQMMSAGDTGTMLRDVEKVKISLRYDIFKIWWHGILLKSGLGINRKNTTVPSFTFHDFQ